MQSPMTPAKAHKLNAIYAAKPYDQKTIVDGHKAILVYTAEQVTILIRLVDLLDWEIETLLPPGYYMAE